MRTVTGRRKLHIVKRVIATLLSVTIVSLNLGVIESHAAFFGDFGYTYPKGHGLGAVDQTDLYLWHLVDATGKEGVTKKFDDYLMNKDSKEPYRLLLSFYDGDTAYYYEANPTELEYGKSTSWVAGTYGKVTSVAENPQVRIGEKQFVTRGGLRSFYCKRTGTTGYTDFVEGGHKYTFYAPNDKDNGIDVEAGKDVSLYFTRDNVHDEVIGLWMYDGSGNPMGGSQYSSAWSDSNNKLSHFNGKNLSYSNEWHISESNSMHGMTSYVIESEENHDIRLGGLFGMDYIPRLCHATDIGEFEDAKVPKNSFTLDELSFQGTHERDQWILYVGEKVGSLADLCSGGYQTTLSHSLVIDAPSYIKRGNTLIVEKGQVLFVKSMLVLEGKIENKGLIVVLKGGTITGNYIPGSTWGDENEYIHCDGGDLFIRNGGTVAIDNLLIDNYGQLMPRGRLLVKEHLELRDCLVDFSKTSQTTGFSTYLKNNAVGKYIPRYCINVKGYNSFTYEFNGITPKSGSGQFIENGNGKRTKYFG